MDAENVKEFGLALEGEEALTEYVEAQQAEAERASPSIRRPCSTTTTSATPTARSSRGPR